jgi:hypothetical protein
VIERAGQLLYGEHYRQVLARALEVNERTLRRWIHDDYRLDVLYQLLAERRAAIAALQHELFRQLYPEERTP